MGVSSQFGFRKMRLRGMVKNRCKVNLLAAARPGVVAGWGGGMGARDDALPLVAFGLREIEDPYAGVNVAPVPPPAVARSSEFERRSGAGCPRPPSLFLQQRTVVRLEVPARLPTTPPLALRSAVILGCWS